MRAARLATLAWLFSHVGQESISIFILFSNLTGDRASRPVVGTLHLGYFLALTTFPVVALTRAT